MTTWTRRRSGENRQRLAKPFCKCYEENNTIPKEVENPNGCKCGEHADIREWEWESVTDTDSSLVIMSLDHKQVTFHPFYSAGTAMVRGNTPLAHDYHYYWEVKMLTEPYGTDIMVGLGTSKVNSVESRYRFTSLLGQDAESYGLSYTGAIRHNDKVTRDGTGFCRGSIVGVKVNLWQGTLEFFLNREPRGISFYNLRRHPTQTLYPMICSTAAQSSMRLIYAGSWQASLLVDAAKILGASVRGDLPIPPGLKKQINTAFWLMLPNSSCIKDDKAKLMRLLAEENAAAEKADTNNYIFSYDLPYAINHYYTDSVSENSRISLIYDDLGNDR